MLSPVASPHLHCTESGALDKSKNSLSGLVQCRLIVCFRVENGCHGENLIRETERIIGSINPSLSSLDLLRLSRLIVPQLGELCSATLVFLE
jgi:hypothetical protein